MVAPDVGDDVLRQPNVGLVPAEPRGDFGAGGPNRVVHTPRPIYEYGRAEGQFGERAQLPLVRDAVGGLAQRGAPAPSRRPSRLASASRMVARSSRKSCGSGWSQRPRLAASSKRWAASRSAQGLLW